MSVHMSGCPFLGFVQVSISAREQREKRPRAHYAASDSLQQVRLKDGAAVHEYGHLLVVRLRKREECQHVRDPVRRPGLNLAPAEGRKICPSILRIATGVCLADGHVALPPRGNS